MSSSRLPDASSLDLSEWTRRGALGGALRCEAAGSRLALVRTVMPDDRPLGVPLLRVLSVDPGRPSVAVGMIACARQ